MTQTSPRKSQPTKKSEVNVSNDNGNGRNAKDALSRATAKFSDSPIMKWWQKQNIRFKITFTAVALGIVPVVGISAVVLPTVAINFRQQIIEQEKLEVSAIAQEINIYLRDRYGDIKVLTQLVESYNAPINQNKTQLTRQLNKFQEIHPDYNSIGIFDNKGDLIAQTKGKTLGNHLNRGYIQAAKAVNGPIISQPLISKSSGIFSVYFANVIKNSAGENVGFIRARLPVKKIQEIFALDQNLLQNRNIYLVNDKNEVFLSSQNEYVATNLSSGEQADTSAQYQAISLDKLFSKAQATNDSVQVQIIEDLNQLENEKQLVAYRNLGLKLDNNALNWNAIIAADKDIIFGPVNRAVGLTLLGIIISAVAISYISYLLAKQLIEPIEKTSNTVKEIAMGYFDKEIAVEGDDEIAQLGMNINQMTSQLKNLLFDQQNLARQSSLLKNLTLEMTKALSVNEVFDIAAEQIRDTIKSDRVVIYSFDEEWQGTIIAESVDDQYPQSLGAQIKDPCFAEKYVEQYLSGRIQTIPDIYKAGLTDCHLQQLEPFQVKASMVAPIIVNDKLLALLIAHQCSSPRNWNGQDIDFFVQTATQMGPAIERARLVEAQKIDNLLSQKLKDIAVSITETIDHDQVFEVTTNQGRDTLKCDRMAIYAFDEDWQGTIVAESVDERYPQALGSQIKDPCFAENYVEQYLQGRVQATNNIYTAGLTACHIQQLEPFEVKANLVAPVIVEGNLLALLIAHQCDAPRNWTNSESKFLAQLATQIGPAIERINLLAQQQQAQLAQIEAREKMQRRALELLMQVDPVSQGDLTIRATVTEDEIGTIADSYNATIENLRKIVSQVQGGTLAVNEVVTEQENEVENLNNEVIRQVEDINVALEKVEALAFSARAVLENAEQAEIAVEQANRSVEEGELAMNRTVDGILGIRETVAETAKKVKRLGESTQKISKVVNLISSFADQTNLLALNASIEAAHAGEEGRGFAVVADEVRSLARQSADATAEIEKVVAGIQEETNEVVQAMESGTEQVVEGTKLVEETRASLSDITAAAAEISQLVSSIASSAAQQSQTSDDISLTIMGVAEISNETSDAVKKVSQTFKKLLQVSEDLQLSVSQFKIN